MNLKEVRLEIEQRIGQRLVAAVLDKEITEHTSWGTCGCSFCELKRKATVRIGCLREPDRHKRTLLRKQEAKKIREQLILLAEIF